MPQSRTSTSTRLSSKSGRTRRYRTIAHNSHIDETLFGNFKQSDLNLAKGTQSCSAPVKKPEKPEEIHIISKDLIRNIRIPKKDPSGQSVILCPGEIERIISNSRVLTKDEREAALENQHKALEEALDSAGERKKLIQKADLSRQKNEGLSELEVETRERDQYLLERANALRIEQEDEIKMLNELILGAQCHAVRDAQIEEKKQILSELQEEQRRLDAMMEVERQRALEAQEQHNEHLKSQRLQGKMCIVKQIEERQEERMLQNELKEQEGQQLLENLEKLQLEELEAMERRKEEQRTLQQHILKINAETLRAKERRQEEERQADLQAMEYTRNKMLREEEYEAEQKRLKKEKEMEVARLRALQERDRDDKAERDALRARRNQEAAEREWRKKERDQAMKKMQENEKMKAVRLEQIDHKERMLSIEAGRERAEFERLLRVQQELIEQQREKDERHQQQVLHHAEGVRQQVREREAQTIIRRREIFREGEKLDEESRNRQARLDEIKQKKLKELREAGLPEKYCNEVERKHYVLSKPVR